VAANHNHLLRMFRSWNVADYIRRVHRAAGRPVLHIQLHAYSLAGVEEAFKLLLIFGDHADYRNVIKGVEAERTSVSQSHASRDRSSLAAYYP
jgi:hypothetical protein